MTVDRFGSGSPPAASYSGPLIRDRGVWWDEANATEAEAGRQLRIDLLRQVTNRGRRILRFRGVPDRFERYPAMADRLVSIETKG